MHASAGLVTSQLGYFEGFMLKKSTSTEVWVESVTRYLCAWSYACVWARARAISRVVGKGKGNAKAHLDEESNRVIGR